MSFPLRYFPASCSIALALLMLGWATGGANASSDHESSSGESAADIWGDVDCGSQANPVDALQILRHDAGLSTPATLGCYEIGSVLIWTDFVPVLVRWGDHDCSAAADPVDALRTLRFDAGLPVTPLQGCPDIGDEVTVQEPEHIVMDDDFFEHEGETNPDIEIAADSQVLFAVPNEGDNTHNLHVDVTGGGFSSCAGGDICTDPEVVPPGLEAGLRVDLPAGTYDFRCDFHPEDMTGTFIAQ